MVKKEQKKHTPEPEKKFQFALKIGWRALVEGEPAKTFPNWRRGRDSNPRYRLRYNTLAGCPFQPLRHLSMDKFIIVDLIRYIFFFSFNFFI